MDKIPPQLDPKLKEAYDRVMGTAVNPPQHTAVAAPPPPSQAAVNVPTQEPTHVEPAMAASPTSSPVAQKAVAKKHRLSPMIWVLIVVIFIAAYSVVWIKFLNFKVPFLNP